MRVFKGLFRKDVRSQRRLSSAERGIL